MSFGNIIIMMSKLAQSRETLRSWVKSRIANPRHRVLSPFTIKDIGAKYCSGNIDAFIMKNDPLNSIQNFEAISLPSVNGYRNIISPNKTNGGHSIGNMLIELGGHPVSPPKKASSIKQFENYIRNAALRGFQ